MNTLLIFFAIPIAVIILSSIFETFIKSPLKIAGIFFSIFLVIAFAFGGTAEYLVAVIIYTIISFIVAYFVYFIQNGNVRRNCTRRDYYVEPRIPISNNNFLNNDNEFEVPEFRTGLDNNVVQNSFDTTTNSNTCPYRRY